MLYWLRKRLVEFADADAGAGAGTMKLLDRAAFVGV